MTDTVSKSTRSKIMSAIKSMSRLEQLFMVGMVFAGKSDFAMHGWGLPGKPDLVFVNEKIAIQVDGCYWHCCPDHGSMPKSNEEFWRKKFIGNVGRDSRNNLVLRNMGWKVIHVWECEIRADMEGTVNKVIRCMKRPHRPGTYYIPSRKKPRLPWA